MSDDSSSDDKILHATNRWLLRFGEQLLSPLQGIVSAVDRMSETCLTREQREFLLIVRDLVRKVGRPLDDLVEFAQLLAGTPLLNDQPFNLRRTLRGVHSRLIESTQVKGLEWIMDVRPDVPDLLRGDSERLARMICTLGQEVIRNTSQGPIELLISAHSSTSGVIRLSLLFRVDSGLHPTTRTNLNAQTPFTDHSTALDIPIALRIIQAMNGEIRCTDVGIECDIQLAIVERTLPTEAEFLARAARWRILIIAAHEPTRQTLRDLVSAWNSAVTVVDTATAGLSALWRAALLGRAYSLCLVDLRSPGDGWQLIEQIKSDSELRAGPVVALGQLEDPLQLERARQFGIVMVRKPLGPQDLADGVRRAMQMPAVEPESVAPLPIAPLADPGIRLLLADANDIDQLLVRHWLECDGHHLVAVSTLAEALDRMGKELFDLLIIDMELPDLDGFQAARLFHRDSRNAQCPIIGLVPYRDDSIVEQAQTAGINDLLTRPLNKLDFQRHVARWTRGSFIDPIQHEKGMALLDPRQILASTEGKESLLRKLVAVYRQRVPESVVHLKDALSHAQTAAIRLAIHTLRGLVATFSEKVSHDLLDFESAMSAGASSSFDAIESSLQQLEGALARVTIQDLRQMLHPPTTP